MHVPQFLRAGPLVEIVDILGDEQEFPGETALEGGQCQMGRVGGDIGCKEGPAPGRVEGEDLLGMTGEGHGRGQVLRPEVSPQTRGPAKRRKPGLRGDAGPGQDDDPRKMAFLGHRRGVVDDSSRLSVLP